MQGNDPGFAPEEVTGLLAGGVPPREVRRIMTTFPDRATWLAAEPDARSASLEPIDPGCPTVLLGSAGYPSFLLRLSSPPPVLYYEGSIETLKVGVGVIGSREMTSLGRAVAEVAVQAAGSAEAVVVSGLARGVDEFAHRTALAGGIPCVGFVGGSLDCLSAREADLLAEVVAEGGVVLSELPPGRRSTAGSLMARNRLIAAASCPLVPCEASLPGGTTACVAAAAEVGAPVVVPVPRPGHRNTSGARGLLALAGLGEADLLDWPRKLLERLERGGVVNAVAHEREDLALFVRILSWMGRPHPDAPL